MIPRTGLLGGSRDRQKKRLQGLLQAPAVTPPPVIDPETGLPYPSGEANLADERGRGGGQPVARDLGDFASRVMQGLGMMGPVGLVSGLALSSENARAAQDAINSMNVAGGVLNPELAGRNNAGPAAGGGVDLSGAGMGGQTAGGFSGTGVEGVAGFLHKGGKVPKRGLLDVDPPGPDNVLIGAKTGERVLTQAQYKSLSKAARAEIDAALTKAKRK